MFHNFRFQTKIILVQNAIILFVVITLGSIYYHKVMTTMTESIYEDFRIVSDSIINQLDNHYYTMDKTALQIAANPDIVSIFRNLGEASDTNYFDQEPFANAKVVKLLNSYNFKKDGFERICLYNQNHDFVYTATAITTNSGIKKWFESSRFRDMQLYFEQEGHHVYYSNPMDDILNDTGMSEKPYFSVIRQIKNYTTNEQVCGYVEVQESLGWLNHVVEHEGEDTYMVLLDGNDIIYKSPSIKNNRMDQKLKRIMPDAVKLMKKGGAADISGYSVYTGSISNTPYQILFIKEKSQELSFFNQYNLAILLTIFLILLIAVATEILIIRRLSRPLKQLNESVGRVTPDHPQLEVEYWKNNDEFVRLQWAFNTMLEQMKEAMEREYASAANELEAQLFALQSQMNPHFLYNILAIISIEALEYGNDKIPNMCTRLRRMLVYGSSIGDGYSRMKEEIDYVLDYMGLMKERYEELFEYHIEADEQLSQTKIPKYIIQPICENCFKHSFKNTDPIWKIRISVFKREHKWMVEIHDNGIGFSKEYLDKFEKMKAEFTFEQVRNKLKDSKVEGLGIPNIYMRLILCYENDFVFRLYNDDEGAVVLIGGRLND